GCSHEKVGLRQVELEGQLVGANVRVDRNDRNSERIEREPMQKECGAVLQPQGDARSTSIAGGGILCAQTIDVRLECAVGNSEPFGRVAKPGTRRCEQE